MESVKLKIDAAVSNIMLDGEASDHVKELRVDALRCVTLIIEHYYSRFGRHNSIIAVIGEKKIAQILEATLKSEMDLIVSPPRVHYNFREVVPSNRFVIPEEELLIWSLTSLAAPLVRDGFVRFMKVFIEVFPEYAFVFDSYKM
jgi:hypothetical protein